MSAIALLERRQVGIFGRDLRFRAPCASCAISAGAGIARQRRSGRAACPPAVCGSGASSTWRISRSASAMKSASTSTWRLGLPVSLTLELRGVEERNALCGGISVLRVLPIRSIELRLHFRHPLADRYRALQFCCTTPGRSRFFPFNCDTVALQSPPDKRGEADQRRSAFRLFWGRGQSRKRGGIRLTRPMNEVVPVWARRRSAMPSPAAVRGSASDVFCVRTRASGT